MNADHISIDGPRYHGTHRSYIVRIFGRRIVTTVAHRAVAVRQWLFDIRCKHDLESLVVGLGVQWRPNSRRGLPDPQPATIQLCVGYRCLIFQLKHATCIPAALRRFLSNPSITFVGVGHKQDCAKLTMVGLKVAKGREIREMAERSMGRSNASMESLAKGLLGYGGIKKPVKIGMSSWDVTILSNKQVQYATVDSYIALRLGLHLGNFS